jgi:hypothetical protein
MLPQAGGASFRSWYRLRICPSRPRALWRIALVRMHCHQPTKDYVARRTAKGKTKTEILRCLKRYIARETYPYLTKLTTAQTRYHAPRPLVLTLRRETA